MSIVPNSISRSAGRHILSLKKTSPRIMFVAGIGGVVVSTVLACRATLKLEAVIADVEADIDGVKENLAETESYQRDLAYVYGKGVISVAKLYIPAVVVGGASIAALTGSHVTLSRRNASLTAAYAAVAKGFDEYRDRVRTEIGPEKELDIYRGVTEVEIKNEEGKKELVKLVDPNKLSIYARIFDESSTEWQKNAELNRIFIQVQQNYANQLLQSRGHVFLNEVYDMLGLDRSSAGQVVGWVISQDGDNYIDFGLFEAGQTQFVNGWERSVVLDFNVDGVIYDKI